MSFVRALSVALLLLAAQALEAGAQGPLLYGTTSTPGWVEGAALTRMQVGEGQSTLAVLADAEAGLQIYDASDPSEPVLLASLLPTSASCPSGFFPDDVHLLGQRAYLAAGRCGVLVIDLGDPTDPQIVLRVSSPSWAKEALPRAAEGGVELFVADYFAGLRVIDLAETNGSLTWSERLVLGPAQGILGSALAVDADPESGIVVVATTEGVFDVIFGGPQPVVGAFLTNADGLPLDEQTAIPQDVSVRDDFAYVPLWQGGLVVVDLLDPSDPTPFGNPSVDTSHAFFKALPMPSGQTLLASEGQCGLAVFDLSSEGLFERPGSPFGVAGSDPEACGPEVTDQALPFAWALAELDGLVAVGAGALAGGGGFELVDALEIEVLAAGALPAPDGDGDGVADAHDDCLERANADQADADRDGFGNACDADFDDNGVVGVSDWARLAVAFGAAAGSPRYAAELDLDADGVVGTLDLVRVARSLGSAPGPSGLACAGTVPCPEP
jgi:hypothetical protein